MKSILYKPILILVIVAVFFLSRTAISQVTILNNTNTAGTNFLGWNNLGPSADLNFRTNNVQRMTLTQNVGRLGLGVTAPASLLHLGRTTNSLGSLFRTDGVQTNTNVWDLRTGGEL